MHALKNYVRIQKQNKIMNIFQDKNVEIEPLKKTQT